LKSDFIDIYLFARHLGMKVMIFTNATLITPRLAGILSRTPPLDNMEISIYGMRAGSYEAVTRSPGSFEAARRGLGLLVEHRIPFVLKSALLPANKGEKGEFEAWAAGLPGGGEKPSFVAALDLRSRPDAARSGLIRSLRLPPPEAAGLLTGLDRDGGEERRRFVADFGGARGDRLFTCLEGGGRGAVDAYGHFQYCLTLRHPDTIYDLKQGSLREAVLELAPRLRKLRARDPEYLRSCGRCLLKALCLQCPAKSWAEHGTLDTPVDYFCEITHAQAEALGLLAAGEKAWTVEDWEPRVERVAGLRPGKGADDGQCREG
jgi:radical SAM protein with 4Fe4S-binding SPASM domain